MIDAIKMFNQTDGIALGNPVGGKWTILRTRDGGQTWSRISAEPPQIGGASGGTGFGTFDTSYAWFFDNKGGEYISSRGVDSWSYYPGSSTADSGTRHLWMNARDRALFVGSDAVYGYDGVWFTGGTLPLFNYAPVTGLVGATSTSDFWLVQGSIYFTSNFGRTWTASPPNGLDKPTTLIDMVTSGTDVSAWAIGMGDTVYHYQRILTGVVDAPQPVPQKISLSQNYPNPFNPTTTIKYSLPTEAFVRLSVYNMLGQEVAVLVNEQQSVGYRSVSFRADNLPSGIYTYRLTAGTFTQVKKMILVK